MDGHFLQLIKIHMFKLKLAFTSKYKKLNTNIGNSLKHIR